MDQPIRILLADDHAVVRAGTRQFLETADDLVVIAEADDGTSAQNMIAADPPDIAVLDIRMPGANGIEVTRWIRAHYPEVRVLILSAYDDDPYIKAVLAAGAQGYMLKTADPAALVDAVRDVYRGRPFTGPDVVARPSVPDGGAEADQVEWEELTERELEVLQLTGRGFTNKGIALRLGISSRTVQGHLANIYAKLRVSSRTEAVMKAVSLGWLDVE